MPMRVHDHHVWTVAVAGQENDNDVENGDTENDDITWVAHFLCRVFSQCVLHSPRMGLDKHICTWCMYYIGRHTIQKGSNSMLVLSSTLPNIGVATATATGITLSLVDGLT